MTRKSVLTCLFSIVLLTAYSASAQDNQKADSNSADELNAYDTAKNSLAYIYNDGLKPCSNKTEEQGQPSGTGFFVAIVEVDKESKTTGRSLKFLVTNQHVLQNASPQPGGTTQWTQKNAVILRVNSKDQSTPICHRLELIWDGQKKNVFTLKPEVDLAAVPVPNIDGAWPAMFEFNTMVLGNDQQNAMEVAVGTDVFTVGYLLNYPGLHKNIPVARFGKIAMMSDENWFTSERGLKEKAFLVELNTTYGASGSPVLLEPRQIRISKQFQYRKVPPSVIGVIKGSTNTLSPVAIINRERKSLQIEAERKALAPIGLAAVEPGENLKLLLKSIASKLQAGGFNVFGPH